jgi:hypothetical protein
VEGSSLVIEALRGLHYSEGLSLAHRPGPNAPAKLGLRAYPPRTFHIILGDALPRSGTPTPVGPGRSGFSLRRAGGMAMLRGCEAGRKGQAQRVWGNPAPLLEAGECRQHSPAFFLLSGAEAACSHTSSYKTAARIHSKNLQPQS